MRTSEAIAVVAGPEEGVYRWANTVAGCPVWYAIDWTGEVVAARVIVPGGQSEAQAKAELAKVAGIESGPPLTLIDPHRSSDSSFLSLLSGALRGRLPHAPRLAPPE